jgi:hypothetical protein
MIVIPNIGDLDVSKGLFGFVDGLVDFLVVLDACSKVFGSHLGILTGEVVSQSGVWLKEMFTLCSRGK